MMLTDLLALASRTFAWLLIATLLLVGSSSGSEKCTYDDAHTIANCSNSNLTDIPWRLHKRILILDLSGNYFPVLKSRSFISFNYISHLFLKNNSMQSLEDEALQDMTYLSLLDLSNNHLSQVPTSALKSVSLSLTQLYLSGNRIQVIHKGAFKDLKNLKILELNGNSITRIDMGGLSGLSSLNVLKLRHNALYTLPPDVFKEFSSTIKIIQLYDNRWMCDCNMRWLRTWLDNTNQEVWKAEGYFIRCDGPSIVKDKPLDSLPMDELACEVKMKSSSSTENLKQGDNSTLVCKYTSVPDADTKWLKNSEVIEPSKDPNKYNISTNITERNQEIIHTSMLTIFNFQYSDIARYQCFVQNILGAHRTEYTVTLEGVNINSITPEPPGSFKSSPGVDTKSIVIAVAVVCGIILFVVIGILIFCTVNRIQRRKMDKQNQIAENLKQHFMNNSEISNGDIAGQNETKLSNKLTEDKLDGNQEDDRSTSNNTNDSTMTAVKRPLDLDDREPLYIFQQPGSPFNNGNTYVSFGSELTDPDMMPPQPPQYSIASAPRYESSHAGSATPLLDRYTPSVYDSSEPDYAQYPVYDSVTKSLHHPVNEGIYGGSLRMGSTSSYASTPIRDGNKRLSSFNYPPNINGTMPIGSTRSIVALMPKYADQNGDSSPRSDFHRYTPQTNDYRDYRDMRYPATTPPPHRMTYATPKSMSVGNLGFAPISTGPRKPPRMFQSREYMELTPQESHLDYITSPEAQQYSQNYGITPGTPV
ncbi:leucine-rich repeat-containing protein 24 [Biomphalaria pfeifferi]|uniref:Leucine-rich repeat-containing protein 24 n=1 Tax=Biomphalaria pfeifferi TaxID=112525 RepID=A0AAD8BE55_BIOPF|nr:leucine-rich repeat-containing protein 24 [Biomphalaria pfeifferi]